MAAAGAVPVGLLVHAAIVAGRATGRIGAADGQMMLLDARGPNMVQMAVVQVIDVALVLDGHVAAVGTVLMIVVGMMRMGSSQGLTSS